MKMKKQIFVVAVMAVAAFLAGGCATVQKVNLNGNEQEIYSSNHRGVFPGPDNVVSAATAYSIIEKTNAETGLIASYSQAGVQTNPGGEALGFIINDKYSKWNLVIKTKIGKLTIFQRDVPPGKLEYKLRWGEYITVWTNGYEKYTDTLKVMPYADVRTMIKREGKEKEEETRGYWMTHLLQ
ncbi:MAG: hypothetical protein AUK20_01210 [Parcubacteria group bacterium CG2_30_45_37]|nr:MAG: hypothetical protein AUK20_01210 [Parcubacteria group bacterium CG2_30_45_37]